jgi:hypothetical protein
MIKQMFEDVLQQAHMMHAWMMDKINDERGDSTNVSQVIWVVIAVVIAAVIVGVIWSFVQDQLAKISFDMP